MPGRIRDRALIQKIINRSKIGTLRAKWLSDLEDKEDLGVLTYFIERHTKGCNNAAIKRYFLMDKSYTLIELYRKWYKQHRNNKWEDFCM